MVPLRAFGNETRTTHDGLSSWVARILVQRKGKFVLTGGLHVVDCKRQTIVSLDGPSGNHDQSDVGLAASFRIDTTTAAGPHTDPMFDLRKERARYSSSPSFTSIVSSYVQYTDCLSSSQTKDYNRECPIVYAQATSKHGTKKRSDAVMWACYTRTYNMYSKHVSQVQQ